MDVSKGMGAVRPWLYWIVMTEVFIILLFLMPCFCDGFCSLETIRKAWILPYSAAILKYVIWGIVEYFLYEDIISKDCSGMVYGLGVLLLVIHITIICTFWKAINRE